MKIFAALLVLLPVTLMAQDDPVPAPDSDDGDMPKAVLEAPELVDESETIVIDASKSVGDHFSYQMYYHEGSGADEDEIRRVRQMIDYLEGRNFRVIPLKGTPAEDFYTFNDGKIIVPKYSIAGRHYVVFLSVSNANGIDSIVRQVRVRGDTPRPPPDDPDDPDDPDPPPPPPPVNPFADLTEDVKKWAASYPVEQRQAVSRVFATEAGRNHTTVKALSDATSAGMQSVLGNDYPSWLTFRINMAQELTALKNAGRLSDMTTHYQAWQAIAKGLE